MSAQDQPTGVQLTSPQRFFQYFQHEITALQREMGRLTDTAFIGGERSDATDHCLAGIARLSNEVKDASSYLPAYDQRTYAEAIKALQEKLEETRNSFAPKPKFSFKSAPKSPSSLSLSDAAELAAEKRRGVPGYQSSGSSFANTPAFNMTPQNEAESPGQDGENPERQEGAKDGKEQTLKPDNAKSSTKQASPGRPPLYSASTVVSINNQSDTHIILPSSSLHSQAPCSLQKISGCVVDLSVPTTASAPFASLTVNNVNSSLLLCGWVLGPAHITGMKNSVLVIKCQQLRMHECENVSVYLDCASRPIIEDCTSIRFTTLPEFQSDLIASSQTPPDQKPNQWDQVDDFKWLKAEPSPNWSVLALADRVPDETWREIVPGGPGWKLKDILKAVGVKAAGVNDR